MKAIIVTHPTQGIKACLYGIDYDKLCKLAELRAKNKQTIKARFKTISFNDEFELANKTQQVSKYKITDEMFKNEVLSYFNC